MGVRFRPNPRAQAARWGKSSTHSQEESGDETFTIGFRAPTNHSHSNLSSKEGDKKVDPPPLTTAHPIPRTSSSVRSLTAALGGAVSVYLVFSLVCRLPSPLSSGSAALFPPACAAPAPAPVRAAIRRERPRAPPATSVPVSSSVAPS